MFSKSTVASSWSLGRALILCMFVPIPLLAQGSTPSLEVVSLSSDLKVVRGTPSSAKFWVRNISGEDLRVTKMECRWQTKEGTKAEFKPPEFFGLSGVVLPKDQSAELSLSFPAYESSNKYVGELWLTAGDRSGAFYKFNLEVKEPEPPPMKQGWALVVAFAVAAVLAIAAIRVRTRTKRSFLQSPDLEYSVSKFQILAWTVVILFSYVFLGCKMGPNVILPESIWYLLGISVASTGTSRLIATSRCRQMGDGVIPTPILDPHTPSVGFLASMLSEDGQPSLMRLQMFVWTIVAIVLFMRQVFLTNTMWDVPGGLLVLMGLSHAGYLTDKGVAEVRRLKIESVEPESVKAAEHQKIRIVGQNFSPKIEVFVGAEPLTDYTRDSQRIEGELNAKDLKSGKYNVIVQQPGEAAVVKEDAIVVG